MKLLRMDSDPRPYLRWWWFSQAIDGVDIDRQLEWAASEGFGGVEIAWVYPLPGRKPGEAFLSPGWTALCLRAREACERLGLGCDFTYGSIWPFGGSFVEEAYSSQTWQGPSAQRLDRSWEFAQGTAPGRVMDHLSREGFRRYALRMGGALAPALWVYPSADSPRDSLFCDSWEVETEGLWTQGFGEAFRRRFGYSIEPYMGRLGEAPERRYDYRSLVSDYVLREFYAPFAEECEARGAASRVQCHGAPADLISAYALVDIPESEALLFDPEFSSVAASAALLSGRRTVSAEAFTCLYGWLPYPAEGPRLGEELIGDLRLAADAMAASGVNHFVWHGMPFQAQGERSRFYASVYVGPDSSFEPELRGFNEYLSSLSATMKRGGSYAQVACYYPFEDSLMAGELPEALRKPSAAHYWEMQHLARPAEALPYGAAWINGPFLEGAAQRGSSLAAGKASFAALYVDAAYVERGALARMVSLAEAGVRVVLKRPPSEPGTRRSPDYPELAGRLMASSRRRLEDWPGLEPILRPAEGGADALPPFWVRRDGETYLLFAAHPAARGMTYPLPYGRSSQASAIELPLELCLGGFRGRHDFRFGPGESILLRVEASSMERLDLGR